MSAAVRSRVDGLAPDGVTLADLGRWRFRGLPEPVALYQVEAEDLAVDFPPLRSAEPV